MSCCPFGVTSGAPTSFSFGRDIDPLSRMPFLF
jgi:hypothetical protein